MSTLRSIYFDGRRHCLKSVACAIAHPIIERNALLWMATLALHASGTQGLWKTFCQGGGQPPTRINNNKKLIQFSYMMREKKLFKVRKRK